MNKIFTQLVEARGLSPDFLKPKYENLASPDELPDMKKALKRIEKAIKNREKVLVYGDYDVDGVTASTLMEQALKMAGLTEVEIMLPDRFVDGYGMSERLINRAKKDQITLVITVDCGSRNHEIIDKLNQAKIDTIITDHHECEKTIPEAAAVINPHRYDYHGPEELKDLAGVGVAFKLAQGLVKTGKIKEGQEKWLLDLVLLGTICDSMVLSKENRILTYFGKIVLEKTRRKGLLELMKNAGVKQITSESIGFQIGPRLNAAGRLDTAKIALDLLRATSSTEAAKLARKLEELNKKRRDEQRAAVKEITKRYEEHPIDTPVIVETGDYHEGVLCIIAGRLVETYHKPTFVLAEVEKGIFKGSGRSFGDFNLADALLETKDIIEGGGGHAAAAGVQIKQENLYKFYEKINDYYKSLKLKNQERFLKTSADLDIEDLKDFNLELLEDLKTLEPFGPGNEEPIFCLKQAQIIEKKAMGEDQNHLRLDLKKGQKTIKSVAFFAPKDWFSLYEDEKYNFLIKPTENEWNGVRSIEARLIDIEA